MGRVFGRADAGHNGQKFRAGCGADAGQIMGAADNAIEPCRLGKLCKRGGMGARIQFRIEARGPDVVVGEAGQNGHGDELGAPANRLCRRLHHGRAAAGMKIDDGRAWLQAA